MGEAIDQSPIEQRVHIAANYPIHKMFYQAIPHLESRQRAAQAYQQASNLERKHLLLEIIHEHEKSIAQIFGMQNPII